MEEGNVIGIISPPKDNNNTYLYNDYEEEEEEEEEELISGKVYNENDDDEAPEPGQLVKKRKLQNDGKNVSGINIYYPSNQLTLTAISDIMPDYNFMISVDNSFTLSSFMGLCGTISPEIPLKVQKQEDFEGIYCSMTADNHCLKAQFNANVEVLNGLEESAYFCINANSAYSRLSRNKSTLKMTIRKFMSQDKIYFEFVDKYIANQGFWLPRVISTNLYDDNDIQIDENAFEVKIVVKDFIDIVDKTNNPDEQFDIFGFEINSRNKIIRWIVFTTGDNSYYKLYPVENTNEKDYAYAIKNGEIAKATPTISLRYSCKTLRNFLRKIMTSAVIFYIPTAIHPLSIDYELPEQKGFIRLSLPPCHTI